MKGFMGKPVVFIIPIIPIFVLFAVGVYESEDSYLVWATILLVLFVLWVGYILRERIAGISDWVKIPISLTIVFFLHLYAYETEDTAWFALRLIALIALAMWWSHRLFDKKRQQKIESMPNQKIEDMPIKEQCIPKESLTKKVNLEKVDAKLQPNGRNGDIVAKWEKIKANMQPGDELWEFFYSHKTPGKTGGHEGYALVRNGEPIMYLVTMIYC